MIMPLKDFDQEFQDHVAEIVKLPKPPPRWLSLGPSDSPFPLAQIESRAWYEWHWARDIDPTRRRPNIPAWMRAVVIMRDGPVCQLCGGDVDLNDVHLDHIMPFSKGGKTVTSNLQVTHSVCNIRKGAKQNGQD